MLFSAVQWLGKTDEDNIQNILVMFSIQIFFFFTFTFILLNPRNAAQGVQTKSVYENGVKEKNVMVSNGRFYGYKWDTLSLRP